MSIHDFRHEAEERIIALINNRVPLFKVRMGPMGTLDLYIFKDGTQLVIIPGQRESSSRLYDALTRGQTPVLIGSSDIADSLEMTFMCEGKHIILLADRVAVHNPS